ncbi:hypothetical protein C1H76_6607 [Elsinoe australis]|uniref:Uncharacterized protein n=1 Tax=Elsinoe australis TaxID=40998 RepID=A0A4U7B161_9PEZI|nr:hypothetical protein C1H76_6607 [Elsinoe australis]
MALRPSVKDKAQAGPSKVSAGVAGKQMAQHTGDDEAGGSTSNDTSKATSTRNTEAKSIGNALTRAFGGPPTTKTAAWGTVDPALLSATEAVILNNMDVMMDKLDEIGRALRVIWEESHQEAIEDDAGEVGDAEEAEEATVETVSMKRKAMDAGKETVKKGKGKEASETS